MSLQSFVAHQVHLPDDTLALALEGYAFIGNRCRALGTDVFETRLKLQRTICVLGEAAARVFYDSERMQHAAPNRFRATLLTPDAIARLTAVFEAQLLEAVKQWPTRVVLFDAVQDVLARAVCAWAGIAVDDDRRIRDITARGRVSRARAEWWIERQIDQMRTGATAPQGIIGQFAKVDVDRHTAAVELFNIIRPTVAVARYITFCAHALHEFPHTVELLAAPQLLEPFVHEVRRFYPFAPPAVARVRVPFRWHDVDFSEGTRVMLDLYGTNHDERTWPEPDQFRPERFVKSTLEGDPLTIELMKAATRLLTRRLRYDVPAQDLGISLAKVPAVSRMIVENVSASH